MAENLPFEDGSFVRDYFDPNVRRASSSMHQIPPEEVERGVAKLGADLERGRWDERHGHLRELPELDIGLRLVVAELA